MRFSAFLFLCAAAWGVGAATAGPDEKSAELTVRGKRLSQWIADWCNPEWDPQCAAARVIEKVDPMPPANVPALLKALREGACAEEAAVALANVGPQAVPALVCAVHGEDKAVAARAARALGMLGRKAKESVPALAALLVQEDERLTSAAAEALGRIGPIAVEPLRKALSTANKPMRAKILIALGQASRDDKSVTSLLVRSLKDEEGSERDQRRLADALALSSGSAGTVVPALLDWLDDDRLDDKRDLYQSPLRLLSSEAVPYLIAGLEHPRLLAREEAARTLIRFRLKPEPGMPDLIRILRKPEALVRLVAVQILRGAELSPAAMQALLAARRDPDEAVRTAARDALLHERRELKVLLAELQDDDSDIRLFALLALTESCGDPRALLPGLTKALRDDRPFIRSVAADWLGKMGQAAAPGIPELAAALIDAEPEVRCHAAVALYRVSSDKASVPLLVKMLGGPTGETAALHLGLIGGGAVPALQVAARSPDSDVRHDALLALHYVGPPAAPALPLLREALVATDARVRQASAWAIGSIGPAARDAVEDLTVALSDRRVEVRRSAIYSLNAIGPVVVARQLAGKSDTVNVIAALRASGGSDWMVPLARLLGDTDSKVRAIAAEALTGQKVDEHAAVAILTRRFPEESEDVQPQISGALGEAGLVGREALPGLTAALADGDPNVRVLAAEARTKLGRPPAEALPVLTAVLGVRTESARVRAARALGLLGPAAASAAPELIAALTDESPHIRQSSAEALGRLGPAARAAVPALRQSLRDHAPEARVAAALALWKLDDRVSPVVPVLIDSLADDEEETLAALTEIGPEARTAVPVLSRARNRAASKSIAPLAYDRAIKAIDPEAARKAGIR